MAEDNTAHTHSGAFAGMHEHDGGPLHWHDEFGLQLAEDMTEDEIAAKRLDWRMHNVVIVTVGIDIGSSTSHLMFSRIFIQLVGEGTDVQSVVVGREILWESPIILTPYLDDETIDAAALQEFVTNAYEQIGATQNEVDTGAVILTGEALKRKNARAIGEMFAKDTGKFVLASAGHHIEAVLAANGSGTVSRSRRDRRRLLNVDIGGGTTKFALVRDGEILATAAIAIGARLIVKDAEGRVTRLEEAAKRVAAHVGANVALGEVLAPEDEAQIVKTWIDILISLMEGNPPEGLAAELMLTEPLPQDVKPQALTFSGGVSEYIFFRESRSFGDLGLPLAKELRDALTKGRIGLPAIVDPNLGIRATAIGASLFALQVGVNVYVSSESILPLRNVPVLVPTIDLTGEIDAAQVTASIKAAYARSDLEEGEQPIALAFRWSAEDAAEDRVLALAGGIRDGLSRTVESRVPFVLLIDQLVARPLGVALKEQLGVPGELVSLEGVRASEFDFIDVAEMVHPSEVIPVTIKSLLFAGGLDRRSIKQALLEASRAHS